MLHKTGKSISWS